jgi:xenotropic and polytropic retrovirus receptor 1
MKNPERPVHRTLFIGPMPNLTTPSIINRNAHLLAAGLKANPALAQSALLHHLPALTSGIDSTLTAKPDLGLPAMELVREKVVEFHQFMNSELNKIEFFHKLRESQARERLYTLKDQLHEMENRRMRELAKSRGPEERSLDRGRSSKNEGRPCRWGPSVIVKPLSARPYLKLFQATPRRGPTSSSGPSFGVMTRNYIRRYGGHEISHQAAERKLKLALQEFYRELELLNSYILLNRTAVRKLSEAFNYAIHACLPNRCEKFDTAWYASSKTLRGYEREVESLYARYFENGNHNAAVSKLRCTNRKDRHRLGISCQSGVFIGTSLVLTAQGLIFGAQLLRHEDQTIRMQTTYIMQLYGGYFLALLQFSLCSLNCLAWIKNKINYPLIFGINQNHPLNSIDLVGFPSLFFLIFSLFIWMNFGRIGPGELYLYYPVMLIGVTVIIILLPYPILEYRSRKWFAYCHVCTHPIH